MNADQFPDPACSRRSGICCGFNGTYVTANKDCYVSGADIFFAQQLNIRGFHHCIRRFYRTDETLRFNHSECF
jgi:hypothetical protein